MTPQPDLFTPVAPPAPPTGPPKDITRFKAASYEGYVWWRQTSDGRRVFGYVEQCVLVAAERGDTRISPRQFVADARGRLHIEVNDLYTAWMADDLVTRHPHLLALVERRKRRRAKV